MERAYQQIYNIDVANGGDLASFDQYEILGAAYFTKAENHNLSYFECVQEAIKKVRKWKDYLFPDFDINDS